MPDEDKILSQLQLGFGLVSRLELFCEAAPQREVSKLAAAESLGKIMNEFFSRVCNNVSHASGSKELEWRRFWLLGRPVVVEHLMMLASSKSL